MGTNKDGRVTIDGWTSDDIELHTKECDLHYGEEKCTCIMGQLDSVEEDYGDNVAA